LSAKRYAVLSLVLIGILVLAACGGGEPEPTAAPTAEPAAPTEPPPTVAAAPPSPTAGEPEPTQESEQEEMAAEEDVRFEWVSPLSTIEELEPILLLVEDFDGVVAASGSERHIDITYNPDVTDVESLQAEMLQIGQPVEVVEE
jgi:hypothetical protein